MKDQVGFVLDKVALGEVSSSGPAACSSVHQFTYSLLSFGSFSFQEDKRANHGKLPKAVAFRKSWLVKYRSPFMPVLKGSCVVLHYRR